ncbi:DeoR/GlpR transcriptional regulator [Paenibacillus psychroresistens]|uniref:DeoR/GlpR transcriptional regulator n=1 Tax=Paenibacillus psychroresistens TaxID=1778678 RepID=A0A6B8RR15_9BACL|nr:DeoR/GlpR family DNA-binding transcription regulator [Paenibacillus psychroresistens]QGQ98254.1 DeoR/GlpR transcriptional regulator [Paenibacillus psychroresistens]
MLVAERLKRIEHLVNQRGSIRVTELSQLCEVTEETIRKDLDRLESEGRLLRNHGGAVSVKTGQQEIPFFERESENKQQKQNIALEAVRHIQERDTIALDASTTAWYMAKYMPDIHITVLTNSIKVALELNQKPNIKVISTGGVLSSNSFSFVGPLAESALSQFHVNKAFVSCKGVHMERGISESNELQALVKQKMIHSADEVYLLSDYSKFGAQAFALVAPWTRIHHVITDDRTDNSYLDRLREMSVKVTQLTQSLISPSEQKEG